MQHRRRLTVALCLIVLSFIVQMIASVATLVVRRPPLPQQPLLLGESIVTMYPDQAASPDPVATLAASLAETYMPGLGRTISGIVSPQPSLTPDWTRALIEETVTREKAWHSVLLRANDRELIYSASILASVAMNAAGILLLTTLQCSSARA